MANEVEHLFLCLLALYYHLCFSVVNYQLTSTYFSTELSVFSLVIGEGSLNILDTSHLLVKYVVNIFYSVACLFTSLMVSKSSIFLTVLPAPN